MPFALIRFVNYVLGTFSDACRISEIIIRLRGSPVHVSVDFLPPMLSCLHYTLVSLLPSYFIKVINSTVPQHAEYNVMMM